MIERSFGIDDLTALAAPAYLARGQAYFAQGRVRRLRCAPERVSAVVGGTRDYLVRLWWDGASVTDDCSCPLARETHWCKHSVAVALAWLEGGGGTAPQPSDAAVSFGDSELHAFLTAQDAPWLADQLARIAEEDPVVRVRLAAAAGADAAGAECRDLLEEAVLGYEPSVEDWGHGTDDGAERLERAVGALEDLLDYGFTEEAAELAREALELLEERTGGMDTVHSQRLAEMAESPGGGAKG